MTAEDYVRRVGFALVDLPWKTKRDLLAELREHLAELPEETNLVERLGAPEQYAADLRGAAGLERRRGVIAFVRRGRPRTLLLIALALTVLGLIIGAVAWVDSYQPLAFGNGFEYPAGTQDDPGGPGQYVVFHQGRSFQLGVTIRNAGSYTVRVLGVPILPDELFTGRVMMSGVMPNGGGPVARMPFRPFDLKPGQERALVLDGVYRAPSYCNEWTGGSAGGIANFPVRFSFLWRTSTARLPLDLAFVFRKGSCP